MSKAKPLPDAEILREKFTYNPETGELRWRTYGDGKVAGYQHEMPNGLKYRMVHTCSRLMKVHRVIWKMTTGEDPKGVIDHINGDGTDNRWCNLRDVSTKDNGRNARRASNNTSGVTGVTAICNSEKWEAQIMVDGKKLYLGTFKSFKNAVNTRKLAEQLYGFHNNHDRQT